VNYLGVDTFAGGIFLGPGTTAGERVHPRPFLAPILFVGHGESPNWQAGRVNGDPLTLFFEEQYDLLSRLRRGRVYRWEGSGGRWWVADPLRRDLGNAAGGMGFRFEMSLVTYQCDRLEGLRGRPRPKVYLGDSTHSTRWTIAAIEGTAAGGPILTLRADNYMGLLPELDPSKVPPEVGSELGKRLEAVVDSVMRVDPGTTVDCCRHALAIVFGHLAGNRTLELVPGIEKYLATRKGAEQVRTWAGRIVARLHSRTKPSELEKLEFRVLDDGDAQLAVECLAIVLKDVGWAAAG